MCFEKLKKNLIQIYAGIAAFIIYKKKIKDEKANNPYR